ncbi:homeobox-DDT domain protein RLT2-like isoform X2 [Phalaenopsis equestris]|uniref:homeobox-DDT domain protein RLT2-like isoform X2 n=1 Tax=Phalaenopsis equestris TaxID=78828 RepID=UPI0009E1E0AF|nr:homeobox-DDT domain protein RLT2-like isoform X2 [Phalaenopsis equestris]
MEFGDGGGGGSPRDASNGAPKHAKRKMKTPSQIDVLEKAYTVSSRLSEQMRQELALKTELSSREISMWFANKRFQGKQAHLLRESKREDVHPLPIHSNPSGGGSGFVLAACHFMDSTMNEASVSERCSELIRPMGKTQVQQLMPKLQKTHHELDPSVLTFMERKLGGRLIEDGPLVGMTFDPLPPGAFGSPLCSGNEMMRKLKRPTRAPKAKSILKQNAGSTKTSSVFQRTEFNCLQNSLWRMPSDEVGSSVNPDSAHTIGSKSPCISSGKQQPQKKELHPDYAPQAEAQFTIYPINDIVDKFVLTDTLANDVTSQAERLHKSEAARTADEVEAVDRMVACKKQCLKRQTHTDKEMLDHERNNGEAVFHGNQTDEGKLQYVDQLKSCLKTLNNGNIEEEKVRQPEELQLGVASMEEAVNRSSIAHGNIQGNIRLIEDEQLELMKLAASRKGLSSIYSLDKDTLDNLHTFQDMLGTFPPESVPMKRPFPILPWTDSEENVGNLLMVWKFLVTFAGEFGLWPFTLEEFAQAFHMQDSRLLGEIHVAVLKYIIRDLEDSKNTHACAPCFSEDKFDNPESTNSKIVDGVHEWGFDIHFWKNKLNFLTWPEILRQLALSAGFGTKLKASYPNCYGDKTVNAGDRVSSLDKHVGSNSVLVQDKDKSSSCGSSYQVTPGTLVFAVFHALFLAGTEGLTPMEVTDYIQEHQLYEFTTMESAHESISNILSKDAELFERAGLVKYRVKHCFRKDPSIVEKVLADDTKSIQLCRITHFGKKASDENFEDLHLAGSDEDIGDSFTEHPLCGKFTRESSYNLVSTKVSTSLNKSNKNLHTDEPGLINESGVENVDRVSLFFLESAEDEIALSTRNDEIIESIHDVTSATGDGKSSEECSESWIRELTGGEYSSLSIEMRLEVLVALIGVVIDGNSFHVFIEERLKEAHACKKMMLAKLRLDRRLQEERYGLMDDTDYLRANPALGQQFSSKSNCILHEQFEYTPALGLSQLELFIDQKAEMLHSYRLLPLGSDRRHNRYWQFSTSSSRNDPGSGRIFFESRYGFWRVIDSDEAFDALLAVLDTLGIRESNLYFMLKEVEIMFKDTAGRLRNTEFRAEPTICSLQTTITSDYRNSNDNIDDEFCHSASKKYVNYTKWMWQECFNSSLLCAMKYGTKRCEQLLETCHICYQPYLANERHCVICHMTVGMNNNAYEHFTEHVIRCEADLKIQISIPFFPISIQLLKAQLAIVECSIPMEAFHSFWDDGYRKSWGVELKFSSSAREILQSLTVLENAIKRDCLNPDFVTTNELLRSEMDLASNAASASKPIPVIPWIPETTPAVALRLLDFDSSIPYMLQHGLEPPDGTEAGEFLVLPRSTAMDLTHQIEAAFSDDTNDQNGNQGFYSEANCMLQEQANNGIKQSSRTDLQNRNHGKANSILQDFSSSDEAEINKISEEYSDDERDEFGGIEAVESNGCQETVDSYLDIEDIEDYVDEQISEGRHSNIAPEQVGNCWDLKISRWETVLSTKSAGEENSSCEHKIDSF